MIACLHLLCFASNKKHAFENIGSTQNFLKFSLLFSDNSKNPIFPPSPENPIWEEAIMFPMRSLQRGIQELTMEGSKKSFNYCVDSLNFKEDKMGINSRDDNQLEREE